MLSIVTVVYISLSGGVKLSKKELKKLKKRVSYPKCKTFMHFQIYKTYPSNVLCNSDFFEVKHKPR